MRLKRRAIRPKPGEPRCITCGEPVDTSDIYERESTNYSVICPKCAPRYWHNRLTDVYVEIFLAVVLLWQAYAGFTAPDDGGRFNWDLYIAVLLGFVLLVLSVRSWLRLRERLKHSEKLLQDGNDEADGIRGTGSGDGFP